MLLNAESAPLPLVHFVRLLLPSHLFGFAVCINRFIKPFPLTPFICSLADFFAVMVRGLVQWVQYPPSDADGDGDDYNVASWGSRAIQHLARGDKPTKAHFLAAGAEQVLRRILSEIGTSEISKRYGGDALKVLGRQP